MTLFHFANCMAVAYAPYFILYRFSGLSEVGAYWRCVKAGMCYCVTQLIKMVLLATLFPISSDDNQSFKSTLATESVRCIVDSLDFLGIYFAITKLIGRGEMRVLATAVGWGTAELIATRVVPTWVGARGVEFDWRYFQNCLDSNISLILLLSSAALLWLWSRNDLNKSLLPLVLAMLGLILYKPLLFLLVQAYLGLSTWLILLAKFIMSTCIGLVTLHLYTAMKVQT